MAVLLGESCDPGRRGRPFGSYADVQGEWERNEKPGRGYATYRLTVS
ncbi:hypothetical protein [Cohnella boryungensis]